MGVGIIAGGCGHHTQITCHSKKAGEDQKLLSQQKESLQHTKEPSFSLISCYKKSRDIRKISSLKHIKQPGIYLISCYKNCRDIRKISNQKHTKQPAISLISRYKNCRDFGKISNQKHTKQPSICLICLCIKHFLESIWGPIVNKKPESMTLCQIS